MHILEQIIAKKKEEVALRKSKVGLDALQAMPYYARPTISIVNELGKDGASGIIAEFKRRSPSKGLINGEADPVHTTKTYQSAGASAVSILTDETFFGGSDADLMAVRPHLTIPVLRKEFIIDAYQVHEAKAIGADLILLIAACLSPNEVASLSSLAQDLGLEVLLELHDEDELGHVCETVDLVGINNRSLKTFDVNIERSLNMARQLPDGFLKVAESGIDDPAQVRLFRDNGYHACLIGENFMKTQDPGKALAEFITKIGLR